MGRIAEALRANLREIVESDARSLRETDKELKAARAAVAAPELKHSDSIKALLGKGSFQSQTVKTLKGLCKENGIKGYSQLKKAALIDVLKENDAQAPPKPLESLTKKELLALLKQLLQI